MKYQPLNGYTLEDEWLEPTAITHLERNIIFQTSMIMFHVNLQGVSEKCPQIINFNRVFHYKPSILFFPPVLETPLNGYQPCYPSNSTTTTMGICRSTPCHSVQTEDIMEGHDFHGQLMKYMCCVLEDETACHLCV